MSDVTIRTNHHWHNFKYRDEVPAKILASQFDYHDKVDDEGNNEVFDGYFCYRGIWYHLDQIMHLPHGDGPFAGWQGYSSDSYFSGIVVNVSKDGELYQVGRYCS